MASLKAIQVHLPNAAAVAGRVVTFHDGKHVDLGAYVGEDSVVLNPAGETLVAKFQPAAKKAKREKQDEDPDGFTL